ncbi:ABC transporter ATP-binding protein [Fusibacter ferrireducens]|uniref:ABC transporter ATP-binding protein n=1 Tax=Fusibacter ferrireducens TaxID=2785058 RepID=A0ABR9ZV90_9FIRM|nr:ABC transporter ATP-binding protein [Fusibacter ferrireducens]MBF4694372.1 ABC transporter ATP-binding protein [Fusibacter ferrireducens]
MNEPNKKILEIKDLSIFFDISLGTVKAVENVSFDLYEGESLGLVGESGCGKTTTALTTMGMLPDNGYIHSGEIHYEGKNLAPNTEEEWQLYRWNDIAMVFQGAMNALNPVKKISFQIAEAITLHNPNINPNDVKVKIKELFKLVGLDTSRIDNYPHEFSGGMRQRVMIAMALACDPKVLIADEPTTALDVMVQAQIIDLINSLRIKLNMSMIIITHDLSIISETCDRIAVMYAGKIVEIGSVRDIIKNSLHPYTKKLIAAFPNIYGERKMIESIPGTPPNLLDPPKGCRFHLRCSEAIELCKSIEPKLVSFGDGHFAACHLLRGDANE